MPADEEHLDCRACRLRPLNKALLPLLRSRHSSNRRKLRRSPQTIPTLLPSWNRSRRSELKIAMSLALQGQQGRRLNSIRERLLKEVGEEATTASPRSYRTLMATGR